ncbi:SpoIIE family protein phosphatase [Candidatus Peregrinibacteria bacterium]|nr:MAG: SpoIIE family protein phosphatase [Candidatus Peregrinibacteria bacterium]
MFFRRHLFRFYVLFLFILSVFCAAIWVLTAEHVSESGRLGIALGLFTVLAALGFYEFIALPFKKIIREMKALLTGRPYHRVMTTKQNEVGVLAHFFNEVTRNLENISGEVKNHQRLRKELDSAQEIQQLLIPKEAPAIPGLCISAKTRPASEIGGDTFDFYKKGERYFIYIGDSTGHGIPAGIVMVMVDALLETFIDLQNSLTDILVNLNKYLKPHLKPTMFMTMILMEWLPHQHTLKWSGAGHEYLIHFKPKNGQIQSLKAGGIAVGMLADNKAYVQEQNLVLEENDFVVLYSDGIVEAKNMTGEVYGLARLSNFIQNQASEESTPNELFEKIAIDVGRFMEGEVQLDDMTLIVLKHCENSSTQTSSTDWHNAGSTL